MIRKEAAELAPELRILQVQLCKHTKTKKEREQTMSPRSTEEHPKSPNKTTTVDPDVVAGYEDDGDENAKIFPQRLMEILSDPSNHDAISWLPHGRAFIIVNRQKFANMVLPKYFRKTKYTSFTRKLNRWNFTRVTRGPELGAYYHEFFQCGKEALCTQMYCKNERAKFAVSKQSKNQTTPKPVETTSAPTSAAVDATPQVEVVPPSELLRFGSAFSKPVTPTVNPAVQARMMLTGGPERNNGGAGGNVNNHVFANQDPTTRSILDSALHVLHQGHIPHEVSHNFFQTPTPELLMLQAQLAALQHQHQRRQQQPPQAPSSHSALYNYRASAA